MLNRSACLLLIFSITLITSCRYPTPRNEWVSPPPGPICPVPAPPAAVTPGGCVNCRMIPSGYYNNIWIPAHRVCQYRDSGTANRWIDGHWRCVRFIAPNGVCLSWQWKSAHWSNTYIGY